MKKSAELQALKLADIQPHPDNPRVVIREDVVSAIVANLDGEYPQKHAIHVRPYDGKYQVLSGHQRLEAATRKGLKTVWAWVESLDDTTAFMELVTANNQGELSPLEIGIHALKAVPKSEGGRGKKGGLSEYAEKIGKKVQTVSDCRKAAEVVENLPDIRRVLMDKAYHLCAIHALPKSCWQPACEWLAHHEAPVVDVEKRVAQATQFRKDFDAGEWTQYLPKDACTSAVFCGTDPANFNRLLDLAGKVATELQDHGDLSTQWATWLTENAGADSWDIRKVQGKRIELEESLWERKNSKAPATASVVLADPPWKYDFAETDNRQIENQYPTATVEEICSHVNAPWFPPLSDNCVLFLWATAPKLQEALQVMREWGFDYKTHAVWDKGKIGMGYWFRGQHELLLVGVRGDMSPPQAKDRVASVFREARGKHSAKPECVYQAIEFMFPQESKCEIYQRDTRNGWSGCGNEV